MLVNAIVVATGLGDNEYVWLIVCDKLEYIDCVFACDVATGLLLSVGDKESKDGDAFVE